MASKPDKFFQGKSGKWCPRSFGRGGRYRKPPAEQQKINDARLRETWRDLGHVSLRFMPQIRSKEAKTGYFGWASLLGQTWMIDLPEAVDVYDLVRDLRRFIVAWRPMRSRSTSGQSRAAAVLAEWDTLSK